MPDQANDAGNCCEVPEGRGVRLFARVVRLSFIVRFHEATL
jgi:hypothetical protein